MVSTDPNVFPDHPSLSHPLQIELGDESARQLLFQPIRLREGGEGAPGAAGAAGEEEEEEERQGYVRDTVGQAGLLVRHTDRQWLIDARHSPPPP